MLKSLIVTLALVSVAAAGVAGSAQAGRYDCPMPITKGGCPVVVWHPDAESPNTNGN